MAGVAELIRDCIDDCVTAGLHAPTAHGGKHALTLASPETAFAALPPIPAFEKLPVDDVIPRVMETHERLMRAVTIPSARMCVTEVDAGAGEAATWLARLLHEVHALGDVRAQVARVCEAFETLRVGDPRVCTNRALLPENAWTEMPIVPATITPEPADRAAAVKNMFDGRNDTIFRFKTGAPLCSLRLTLPDTARLDLQDYTHVQVIFERDAAPAAVYLQVQPAGAGRDGGNEEWSLADAADLCSCTGTSLSAPPPIRGTVPSPDAPQAPSLNHGVLLCRWTHTSMHGFDDTPVDDPVSLRPLHSGSPSLRLVFRGFHGTNTKRCIGIVSVRFLSVEKSVLRWMLPPNGDMLPHETARCPKPASVHAPVPSRVLVAPVARWLSKVCSSARDDSEHSVEAAVHGLRALVALAAAASSAPVFMSLLSVIVRVLTTVDGWSPLRGPATQALRATRALLHNVELWTHRRSVTSKWATTLQASTVVPQAVFDAAAASDAVTFSNGNQTATFGEPQRGPHSHAVVLGATGFPIRGRHSWTFRVDVDRAGDECITLGFAVRPLRDANYDSSADMWTVRCFNARVYGRVNTRAMGVIPHGPIHRGSEIMFTLEGGARTVSMTVDGVAQGVVFHLPSDEDLNSSALSAARAAGVPPGDVPPPLIFPCVCFYAPGRTVSFVSVSTDVPTIDLSTAVSLCAVPPAPVGDVDVPHQLVPRRTARHVIGGLAAGPHLPTPGLFGTPTPRPPTSTVPEDSSSSPPYVTLAVGEAVPVQRVCIDRRLYARALSLAPDARALNFATDIAARRALAAAAAAHRTGEHPPGPYCTSLWTLSAAARFSVGGGFDRLEFGVGVQLPRHDQTRAAGDDNDTEVLQRNAQIVMLGEGRTRSGESFKRVLFATACDDPEASVAWSTALGPAAVCPRVDAASHAPRSFAVDIREVSLLTVVLLTRVTATCTLEDASEQRAAAYSDAAVAELAQEAVRASEGDRPVFILVDPVLGPAPLAPAPLATHLALGTPVSAPGESILASQPTDACSNADLWEHVTGCMRDLVSLATAAEEPTGVDAQMPSMTFDSWVQELAGAMTTLPEVESAILRPTGMASDSMADPRSAPTASTAPSVEAQAPPPRSRYEADLARAISASLAEAERHVSSLRATIGASAVAAAPVPVPAPAPAAAASPRAVGPAAADSLMMSPADVAALLGFEGELDADMARALLMSMEVAPAVEPAAAAPAAAVADTAYPVSAAPEDVEVTTSSSPSSPSPTMVPAVAMEFTVIGSKPGNWRDVVFTVSTVADMSASPPSTAAASSAPRANVSANHPAALRIAASATRDGDIPPSTPGTLARTSHFRAFLEIGRRAWRAGFSQHTSEWDVELQRAAWAQLKDAASTSIIEETDDMVALEEAARLTEALASPVNTPSGRPPEYGSVAELALPRAGSPVASWIPDMSLLDTLVPLLHACKDAMTERFAEAHDVQHQHAFEAGMLLASMMRWGCNALTVPLPARLSKAAQVALQSTVEAFGDWMSGWASALPKGAPLPWHVHAMACFASAASARVVVAAVPLLATGGASVSNVLISALGAVGGTEPTYRVRTSYLDALISWAAAAVRARALPLLSAGDSSSGDSALMSVEVLWAALHSMHTAAHVHGNVASWRLQLLSATADAVEYDCCALFALPGGASHALARAVRAANAPGSAPSPPGTVLHALRSSDHGGAHALAVRQWDAVLCWALECMAEDAHDSAESGSVCDVIRRLAATAIACSAHPTFATAAGERLTHALKKLPGRHCHTRAELSIVHELASAVFNAPVGNRDDFTGSIGFICDVADAAGAGIVVTALGRSVRGLDQGISLQRPHALTVWDEGTRGLLAVTVVDSCSPVDEAGFAVSRLEYPVYLSPGQRIRVASYEIAGCGDRWHDMVPGSTSEPVSALIDTALILPVSDCFVHAIPAGTANGMVSDRADAASQPAVPELLPAVHGVPGTVAGLPPAARMVAGAVLRFPSESSGKRPGNLGVTLFAAPISRRSACCADAGSATCGTWITEAAAMCLASVAAGSTPSTVDEHDLAWLCDAALAPLMRAPAGSIETLASAWGIEGAPPLPDVWPASVHAANAPPKCLHPADVIYGLLACALQDHAELVERHRHLFGHRVVATGLTECLERWLQACSPESRLVRGKAPRAQRASLAFLAAVLQASPDVAAQIASTLQKIVFEGASESAETPSDEVLAVWKRVKAFRSWCRAALQANTTNADGASERKEVDEHAVVESKEDAPTPSSGPQVEAVDPNAVASAPWFHERMAQHVSRLRKQAGATMMVELSARMASSEFVTGVLDRCLLVTAAQRWTHASPPNNDVVHAVDVASSMSAYVRYGATAGPSHLIAAARLLRVEADAAASAWSLAHELISANLGHPAHCARVVTLLRATLRRRRHADRIVAAAFHRALADVARQQSATAEDLSKPASSAGVYTAEFALLVGRAWECTHSCEGCSSEKSSAMRGPLLPPPGTSASVHVARKTVAVTAPGAQVIKQLSPAAAPPSRSMALVQDDRALAHEGLCLQRSTVGVSAFGAIAKTLSSAITAAAGRLSVVMSSADGGGDVPALRTVVADWEVLRWSPAVVNLLMVDLACSHDGAITAIHELVSGLRTLSGVEAGSPFLKHIHTAEAEKYAETELASVQKAARCLCAQSRATSLARRIRDGTLDALMIAWAIERVHAAATAASTTSPGLVSPEQLAPVCAIVGRHAADKTASPRRTNASVDLITVAACIPSALAILHKLVGSLQFPATDSAPGGLHTFSVDGVRMLAAAEAACVLFAVAEAKATARQLLDGLVRWILCMGSVGYGVRQLAASAHMLYDAYGMSGSGAELLFMNEGDESGGTTSSGSPLNKADPGTILAESLREMLAARRSAFVDCQRRAPIVRLLADARRGVEAHLEAALVAWCARPDSLGSAAAERDVYAAAILICQAAPYWGVQAPVDATDLSAAPHAARLLSLAADSWRWSDACWTSLMRALLMHVSPRVSVLALRCLLFAVTGSPLRSATATQTVFRALRAAHQGGLREHGPEASHPALPETHLFVPVQDHTDDVPSVAGALLLHLLTLYRDSALLNQTGPMVDSKPAGATAACPSGLLWPGVALQCAASAACDAVRGLLANPHCVHVAAAVVKTAMTSVSLAAGQCSVAPAFPGGDHADLAGATAVGLVRPELAVASAALSLWGSTSENECLRSGGRVCVRPAALLRSETDIVPFSDEGDGCLRGAVMRFEPGFPTAMVVPERAADAFQSVYSCDVLSSDALNFAVGALTGALDPTGSVLLGDADSTALAAWHAVQASDDMFAAGHGTLMSAMCDADEIDVGFLMPLASMPPARPELLALSMPAGRRAVHTTARAEAGPADSSTGLRDIIACATLDIPVHTSSSMRSAGTSVSNESGFVAADEVRLATVRFAATAALETLSRSPDVAALVAASGLLHRLCEVSARLVAHPSFVCTYQLLQRSRALSAWAGDTSCLHALTSTLSGGSTSFDDLLASPESLVVRATDTVNRGHARSKSARADARMPASAAATESGEDTARRAAAQVLVSMGFGFDVDACISALIRCNDDLNRTADWLLTPEAQRVLAQEAALRQQAAAARTASEADDSSTLAAAGAPGLASSTSGLVARDAARWSKAEELANIWGMPKQICFQALLMHNEDANAAMSWLMDRGATYLEAFLQDETSGIAAAAESHAEEESRRADALSDAAVFDGVPEAGAVSLLPASPSTRGDAAEGFDAAPSPNSASDPLPRGPSLQAWVAARPAVAPADMLAHRAAVGEAFMRLSLPSAPHAQITSPSGVRFPTRFQGVIDVSSGSLLCLFPAAVLDREGRGAATAMQDRDCICLLTASPATASVTVLPWRAKQVRHSATAFGQPVTSWPAACSLWRSALLDSSIRLARKVVGSTLAALPAPLLPAPASLGGPEALIMLVKLVAATSGAFSATALGGASGEDALDEPDAARSATTAVLLGQPATGPRPARAVLQPTAAPASPGIAGRAGASSPALAALTRPRGRSGSIGALDLGRQRAGSAASPQVSGISGSFPLASSEDVSTHAGASASGLPAFRDVLVRMLLREVNERSLLGSGTHAQGAGRRGSPAATVGATRPARSVLSALSPAWHPPSLSHGGIGAGDAPAGVGATARPALPGSDVAANPLPGSMDQSADLRDSDNASLPVRAIGESPLQVADAAVASPPLAPMLALPPGPIPAGPPQLPAAAARPVQQLASPALRAIGATLQEASSLAPPSPYLLPISTPFLRSLSSGDPSEALPALPPSMSLGASTLSTSTTSSLSTRQIRTRLAQLLLDECVQNFVVTTARAETSVTERAVAESLHPYFHRCEYAGELVCEGARALRITFDPRCELAREGTTLTFYTDSACASVLATYPVRPASGAAPPATERLRGPASFPPLVVQKERVYYRFVSTKREDRDHGWGYRMFAHPMRGLQWTSESQVASDSSLEWACWLLEFMLHDAGRHCRDVFEAVHHRAIYDALIRYLRTPGNPFKPRVTSLLTQLLAVPAAFVSGATPDLSHALGIGDLVLARARKDVDAGRVFLPFSMLRLVELAASAYIAERQFTSRSWGGGATLIGVDGVPMRVMVVPDAMGKPVVKPTMQVELPASEDLQNAKNALLDLVDLCESLGSAPSLLAVERAHGSFAAAFERCQRGTTTTLVQPGALRMPDRLLCRSWLDGCAQVCVVESHHPFRDDERRSGWIVIPNATAIRVVVDRRTELSVGCVLRFWNAAGELVRLCGVLAEADPKFATHASTSPLLSPRRADMKAWLKSGMEVADVMGDRIRYEFRAVARDGTMRLRPDDGPASTGEGDTVLLDSGASNQLGLWGFSFTVGAATCRIAQGTRLARPVELALLHSSPDASHAALSTLSPGSSDTAIVPAMPDSSGDAAVSGSETVPLLQGAAPVDAAIGSSPLTDTCPRGTLSLSMAAVAQALWPRELDELLVKWINEHSARGQGEDEGPEAGTPRSKRTVRNALEMSPLELRFSRREWQYAFEPFARVPLPVMYLRLATLRQFNRRVARVLELVDLAPTASAASRMLVPLLDALLTETPVTQSLGLPTTLSTHLRMAKHLIFYEVKHRLLEAAVQWTWSVASNRMPVSRYAIAIDNMRAMSAVDSAAADSSSNHSVFAQAQRQLAKLGPSGLSALFRTRMDDRGRIFTVKYVGEEGIDYGGVMRDASARMVEDLFSSRIDLFLPCANAGSAAESASNTDKYLPNPRHSNSARALSLYDFVGRLLGLSLRSKLALPFQFPSLVWKDLVGQQWDFSDLQAVDADLANLITEVITWTPPHGTAAAGSSSDSPAAAVSPAGAATAAPMDADASFAAAFAGRDLSFATRSLDGSPVELIPGGATVAVTISNRHDWVAALLQYHMACYDFALRAIRRGLFAVVPARGIRCMTWEELEVACAGRPEIDVRVLKEHTEYEGYRPSDPTIQFFWQVMEEMTNEERSLFVRFAWGRSRLPTTKRWPKRLKLSRRPGGEDQLPVAHTCFNHVELSVASSLEKMRWALMTAIHYGNGGILAA